MTRVLTRRLMLVTLLVVLLPTLGLLIYSFRAFERDLVAEIQKNGTAIARALAKQVDNALGFGIPMEALFGVEPFLDEVLRSSDGVRAVALLDPGGRIVFQRGAEFPAELAIGQGSAALLAEVAAAPAERRIDAIRVTRGTGLVDIALPVFAKGQVAGTLHLGASTTSLERRSLALLLGIVTVLAITAFILHEVLRAMLNVSLAGPTQAAVQVMSRVERGDFTAEVSKTNQDEIGRFARRLNDTVDLVNEHYQRLVALVDAIKSSEFDRQVTRQLDGIVKQVRERFSFATGPLQGETIEAGAVHARILLFLFGALAESLRVFLPSHAMGLVSGGGSPALVAIPLAVFSVVLAALIAVGRFHARLGDRRTFAVGAVLMALSLAIAAAAGDILVLSLSRAIAAVSYAMVLDACLRQGDSQGRPSEAMLMGMLLGADLVGPAIGGLLAEVLGTSGAFWASACGGLAVALLGYQLIRERPQPVRTATSDTLGDPSLVFAALLNSLSIGFTLGGAVLFLVPVQYAGEGPAALARILPLYGLGALLGVWMVYRFQTLFPGLAMAATIVGLLFLPVAPWAAGIGLIAVGIGFGFERTSRDAMIAASGFGFWAADEGQQLFRLARALQPLAAGIGIVTCALLLQFVSFVAAIGACLAVVLVCGLAANLLLRASGGGSAALPEQFYR